MMLGYKGNWQEMKGQGLNGLHSSSRWSFMDTLGQRMGYGIHAGKCCKIINYDCIDGGCNNDRCCTWSQSQSRTFQRVAVVIDTTVTMVVEGDILKSSEP
jgi:hypothetical protein